MGCKGSKSWWPQARSKKFSLVKKFKTLEQNEISDVQNLEKISFEEQIKELHIQHNIEKTAMTIVFKAHTGAVLQLLQEKSQEDLLRETQTFMKEQPDTSKLVTEIKCAEHQQQITEDAEMSELEILQLIQEQEEIIQSVEKVIKEIKADLEIKKDTTKLKVLVKQTRKVRIAIEKEVLFYEEVMKKFR